MTIRVEGMRELNPDDYSFQDSKFVDEEVVEAAKAKQIRVYEVVSASGWKTMYLALNGGQGEHTKQVPPVVQHTVA